MYNEHFQLERLPFSLSPDTYFFCRLDSHVKAMQMVLSSIEQNEGFVKITGPVGTGKTMLCRQLLKKLDDHYAVAYIHNPLLSPLDLYLLIIQDLGGSIPDNADNITIFNALNDLLLSLKKQGKHTVIILDEAQALSDDSLEAMRLLTNLETETNKLLQIVFFGQLELDERLNTKKFLQLRQRIVFSHRLMPLEKKEFMSYIQHRIIKSGQSSQAIFHQSAITEIYKASKGILRVANILCHKSLLLAYANNDVFVSKKIAKHVINESDHTVSKANSFFVRPNKIEWIACILLMSAYIVLMAGVIK